TRLAYPGRPFRLPWRATAHPATPARLQRLRRAPFLLLRRARRRHGGRAILPARAPPPFVRFRRGAPGLGAPALRAVECGSRSPLRVRSLLQRGPTTWRATGEPPAARCPTGTHARPCAKRLRSGSPTRSRSQSAAVAAGRVEVPPAPRRPL